MLRSIYDPDRDGVIDHTNSALLLANGTTTYSIADITSLQNQVTTHELKLSEDWNDAGIYELPTITDNGNGTLTIGSGKALLYDTLEYSGLNKYTLEAHTTSDGVLENLSEGLNYICADYNNGTPRWQTRSGQMYVTLTAATHTFALQFNVESTATTLTVRRASIEAWRVS